ncbi:MAG: BNR-4 repeat-containing protein [Bacteroidota bacterium]
MMKSTVFVLLVAAFILWSSCSTTPGPAPDLQKGRLLSFGQGGQIKMLYDRRQRPPAVLLGDKLHIVFNAGREASKKKKPQTRPQAITYDLATRQFSAIITLGSPDGDHHYGPVIWADTDNFLHVLHGCHRTPGTHLISNNPASIGSSRKDWRQGPQIAGGISYPTVYKIADDRFLMYYRTAGHISSWTYRISADNGLSWTGPEQDVTDMDSKGRFEWSSYHTVLPSEDGRFLHVAFFAYDDNRSNEPERYFNPRYQQAVSNEWKYNLYYLKIDLQTGDVLNVEGEKMDTPIDIDQANARCRIWDTEWRGAGVPPTILLDEEGDPTFLHVLSGKSTQDHHYYYVHLNNGKWEKTRITASNHQWNSCHLSRGQDGTLLAYLIVGEGYVESENYMDRYGGGDLEEWISEDQGMSWRKNRDLTPDRSIYPNWKYNNVQPVTRADGRLVDGMLLFYGWGEGESPEVKAFLLHE